MPCRKTYILSMPKQAKSQGSEKRSNQPCDNRHYDNSQNVPFVHGRFLPSSHLASLMRLVPPTPSVIRW